MAQTFLRLLSMLSSSAPTDAIALQQLLAAETHKNQLALEKIAALEREIRDLKFILTSAGASPANWASDTPKQKHQFSGELILVVDDQELNLNLVASLLEDEHLKVVCKNSAQEALEFLHNQTPAIILMDIQMPQMDGYEATAKIHEHFGQVAPTILAMTANNSEADKQKCLAAGMQGHIGKPIDADYLIEQLHFWIEQANSASAITTVKELATISSDAQSPGIELPGIDLASALMRLRGNRKLLEEVLVSFTQKAASIIPELQQTIDQNNIGEATRILHRLKGTSANLSAYKVAPLAAELESLCKNNQMPTAEQLAQLELHINELIATAELVQSAANEPLQEQSGVDRAQIEPLLQAIVTNLHSDLGKAEEAVEQLNTICGNSPWSSDSKQLREVFYQFNLRAVKDLISQGFQG